MLESLSLTDYQNVLEMNLLFVRRRRKGRIYSRLILGCYESGQNFTKEYRIGLFGVERKAISLKILVPKVTHVKSVRAAMFQSC